MDQDARNLSATSAEHELRKIKQEFERERAELASSKQALQSLRSTINSQLQLTLIHINTGSSKQSLGMSKIYSIDICPFVVKMHKQDHSSVLAILTSSFW
ncbi:hypothetical protein KCU74_g386, partial [Aureobasidium melanogenum]